MRIRRHNNKIKIIMNLHSNVNTRFRKDLNVAFQKGASSIPSVEPGYFRLRVYPVRRSSSIGRYWERVGSYIENAAHIAR